MTGTGIVIPASFELSVVTDPEGKKYPEKVTSSTIQMNISLYMFLAQFLVEKNFKGAGVLIFFRRKRRTGMS